MKTRFKNNYKTTIYACFIGYIVQAIVNNFVPLLFLTFRSTYGISLSKITFLVTFNFGVQLLIDLLSPTFVDKIGYRVSVILAHVFSATGLLALTILPEIFSDPFTGLLVAVMIYALGGGLLEVLISPIVEACPTDNKETAMSMLHSFYCWGHVGVVLLSTGFFSLFGITNWKYMALLWMLVPLCNMILFFFVPMASLIEEGERGLTLPELLSKKKFWLMFLLMICAGASEQAVSQWASAFAEKGLGVAKTIGDLTGPMFFAIMMGTSRALYGKYGEKLKLEKVMVASGALCIISYLMIVLSPVPALSLVGCGICGFSVGILWPGTFSMASAGIRNGGTMMFAFLALGGDVGCSLGPTLVGRVSGMFQENLKIGILAALVFPVILLVGIGINKVWSEGKNEEY
ncbi:MFS transporter [Roseburia sp. 499]|uniref:MFS transporter n=1 Tax=Roseburia sp. 499 TaxID=1261634 RepID=UPI000951FC60|nr:MFS transporter [Roseburia sp. 499]WVK71533.1 MFS transporter [Roseburia sp. 499]